MSTKVAFSPFEYISRVCELHLECNIEGLDPQSRESLDRFLANEVGNNDNNNDEESNNESQPKRDSNITPRLFLWISKSPESSSRLYASNDSFEADNVGALALINISNQVLTMHSQIQCITLAPLQRDSDLGESISGSTLPTDSAQNDSSLSSSTESSINSFRTLQLYTQHAFVPTLKSLQNNESKILQSLEGKIRELDVTLAQCRRSTLSSIPHITLTTHKMLESKASNIPSSGKIDLDALDLTESLSDDEFLNEVQSIVNSWIPAIQKVTMLTSSQPPPDSDWEEVSYWHNLSQALNHIRAELIKPSTLLTLHILKSAKRFVSTLALENNTHLKSAEEYVSDVTSFLKHYPAEALSSSMSWSAINEALEDIFVNCVSRVRSNRYYGLDRLVKLVEASLGTTKTRMEFVLNDQFKANGILWMDFADYEKEVYGPTSDLFVQIDVWIGKFKEFVLDLGRKRKISNIGQILNGMNLQHLLLKERLDLLYNFRSSHEKLRSVVSEVLMAGSGVASSALKDVEEAPMATMGNVNVLDLSEGGKVAFSTALEKYERKIDSIEESLAKLLRDKLTACQVRENSHLDLSTCSIPVTILIALQYFWNLGC